MATFTFGNPSLSVDFDDRLLAHLRSVIVAKLRRSESFLFSWEAQAVLPAATSDGGVTAPGAPVSQLHSLWMHPAIGLQFSIDQEALVGLNRAWLDLLTTSANSNGGLHALAEPVAPEPHGVGAVSAAGAGAGVVAATEIVATAPRKRPRTSSSRA